MQIIDKIVCNKLWTADDEHHKSATMEFQFGCTSSSINKTFIASRVFDPRSNLILHSIYTFDLLTFRFWLIWACLSLSLSLSVHFVSKTNIVKRHSKQRVDGFCLVTNVTIGFHSHSDSEYDRPKWNQIKGFYFI